MEVNVNLKISLDEKTSSIVSKLIDVLAKGTVVAKPSAINDTVNEPVVPVTTTATATTTKAETKKIVKEVVEEVDSTDTEQPVTLEELRKILGEKSRAGFKDQIAEILVNNFGSKTLAKIDPSNYPKVKELVEAL